MKYIYYTYVDAKTRISCFIAPPRNGPDSPALSELTFGFALESRYPTAHPIMYGTCADNADVTLDGVLGEITEEEFNQALNTEMIARRAKIVVSMRQARLALLQVGLLPLISTAINNIEDETQRQQALINWEYAVTVERLDPWVTSLAVSLSLSDQQLDELFAIAATL